MAEKTRTELDAYFNTGDTPTEAEFQDLIDSIPNFQDDVDQYGKEINITAFAGGGQANAYELTKHISVVIVCNNVNDSIKLPAGNSNRDYFILNIGGNNTFLYPPVGGEISNFGLNAGIAIGSGQSCNCFNYDDKKWGIVV